MKTNTSLGAIHPHLFFFVLCLMGLLMSTFVYHTIQQSLSNPGMLIQTALQVKVNTATALK